MDKQKIKSAFSRAAESYDKNAWFPQEMAKGLLRMMPLSLRNSENILDIGCGTGTLVIKLGKRFKKAKIIGFDLAEGMVKEAVQKKDRKGEFFLQADLEKLPFKPNIFNLATSNLVYQRILSLKQAFRKLNKVLAPRAKFYLSVATKDTLLELQSSFISAYKKITRSALRKAYHHPSREKVIQHLQLAGFKVLKTTEFKKKKYYSRPNKIIKWLKAIGANYYYHSWINGLASRKILEEMEDIYKNRFSRNNKIYATFSGLIIEAEKR